MGAKVDVEEGERMIVRDIKATGTRFFVGFSISALVGVFLGKVIILYGYGKFSHVVKVRMK